MITQIKHKRTENRAVSLTAAFLAAECVFLCTAAAFGMIFSPIPAVSVVGGAVFAAVCFLCMFAKRRSCAVFGCIPAALLAILGVVSFANLSGQIGTAANAVLQAVFLRFHRNVSLFEGGGELLSRLFLGCLAAAVTVLLAVTERKAVKLIAAALLVSVSAVFGETLPAVLLVTSAAVLTVSVYGAAQFFSGLLRCVFTAAAFAIAVGSPFSDSISDTVSAAVLSMRYGGSGYSAPNGNIADADAFSANGDAALEVSMDVPEAMYLHGFLGYEYEDGVWSEPDFSEITSAAERCASLCADGFTADGQAAVLYSLAKNGVENSDSVNCVSVQNIGADSRWFYLPNAICDGDFTSGDYPVGLENPTAFFGEDTAYSAYTLTNLVGRNDELAAALEEVKSDGGNESGEYLENAGITDSIYLESFTSIPDSVRRILDAQLADYNCENGDLGGAVSVVYDYLSQFSYDESVGGTSLEDFLQVTKSGYSIHFASAATEILRYYGIPTRYAEGYAVTNSAVEGKLSGSPITLYDSDFHAWAEYYLSGVGWLPLEVTPEYFDKMPLPSGVSANAVSQLANLSGESADSYSPDRVSGDRISDKITESPDENSDRVWTAAIVSLSTLLIVVLIAVARRVFVLRRLKSDPSYALYRCVRLLSHAVAVPADSGGRYDFSAVGDESLVQSLCRLQTDCEMYFYAPHTYNDDDYTSREDYCTFYKDCGKYVRKKLHFPKYAIVSVREFF
jgi:hypothetical protein